MPSENHHEEHHTRLAAFAVALTPVLAQANGPIAAQKFQKKQSMVQQPASSPAGKGLKQPGVLPVGVSPMPVKNAPVAVTKPPAAVTATVKPQAAQIKTVTAAEAPKPKFVNEAKAPTLTPVAPGTPAVNPGQ